jgi:hypothetical protein
MVKHNNTLAKAGNFRKNWQVRIDGGWRIELVWHTREKGDGGGGNKEGQSRRMGMRTRSAVWPNHSQQLNSFALP